MAKKRVPLTPGRVFEQGVIIRNPILVQVIGLCPAVAASADLFVSIALSALVCVLLLVCESVASLFLKKVPRSIRVGLYFLIGLAVCTATTYYAEIYMPELLQHAGVYLPLMAASSAAALRSETFAAKHSFRLSFFDALGNGIGASLVLILSGFVRGLLGAGKIGHTVVFATPPLRGLAMPFGGFIVLGFSAALLKWTISRFFKRYPVQMEFGIRKKKKKKAEALPEEKPTEQTKPAQPEPVDSEESHAAGFYEKAAEEGEQEPEEVLLSAEDFSVQEEIEELLDSFNSFENILNSTEKEDGDA